MDSTSKEEAIHLIFLIQVQIELKTYQPKDYISLVATIYKLIYSPTRWNALGTSKDSSIKTSTTNREQENECVKLYINI